MAHAVFAFILVVGKLLMVQVFPRAMRSVTVAGTLLFMSAMGVIGTTVVWYFYLWLVRGIRPSY